MLSLETWLIRLLLTQIVLLIEIALAWFPPPPNQLAFGHNPNLPFCLNDKPPALEGTTSSEVVAKILIALHAACKACIENDTSEKLRRALRHKIRPITTMTHQ